MSPPGTPRYVPEDSLKSPRFTGPSTFARLPYVRTLEDVDLAVVGVPFDTGVTYRAGGRFGPNAVRAASVMLRPYNANLDVKPFDILSCVDYGDVAIIPGYIERSYEAIEQAVAPIVEAGVVPLLIGGDHACTLPHLRATRSRGPVAVIDFDSHTDAWDSYFGEKYNHGTWMRRAIEEGLVDVDHSIEVGLRGSVYDAEDWTGLRDELGLEYLTTEEVLAIGPEETAATDPRAGRRGDGVHQLRHRHGRPGVRAGHGHAGAGRSVRARRAGDRPAPDRASTSSGSTSSRSSRPTIRPVRRRSSPRTSPTRCCRSSRCAAAQASAATAPELKATTPPRIVASTATSGIRSGGVANRSRSRTTTSASLPTSSVPRRSSAK